MIVYFCFALVIFTIFHPVNPAIYSTSDIIIIKDLVIFACLRNAAVQKVMIVYFCFA